MELGARLELLRKRSGWSKTEVAKRLGLSSSTVCKHEYGDREPDLDTMRRYAELYDVSLEYLLGLIDDPEVTITMIASLNTKQMEGVNSFCDKDIADLKRFLRIFRYVLAEYLLGITLTNQEIVEDDPRNLAITGDQLCEKDIIDLKRFLLTFRGEL